jgi:hypothetical protein
VKLLVERYVCIHIRHFREVSRRVQVNELPLALLRRLYLPRNRDEALRNLLVVLLRLALERLHAFLELSRVEHVLLHNLEYRIFEEMRRDFRIAASRDVVTRVHVLAGAEIALVRGLVVDASLADREVLPDVAAIRGISRTALSAFHEAAQKVVRLRVAVLLLQFLHPRLHAVKELFGVMAGTGTPTHSERSR